MARIGWGKILAGVATAAAAGAAYVYYRQRTARLPLHQTLLSDGAFELRRYPALLLLETIQYGSRDRALGNGFGLLADYMFGEGREGEEIPITMPVLTARTTDGAWRIRFLLPQGIDPLGLDAPGRGISVVELPEREAGVVSVPGKPGDRLFAARAADLRRWIEVQGREVAGEAEYAYHNSPLKPGKPLPNEILIPVGG